MCPKAVLALNETWSFKDGIPRFANTGYQTNKEHFEAIQSCYRKAAEEISADCLIPSGTVVEKMYHTIGETAYRDGFHSHYGITRYALGLLWFMVLTGESVEDNSYRDFDAQVTEEEAALAKRIATETAKEAGFLK